MQYSAVQCSALQCRVVQCSSVQCGAVHCSAGQPKVQYRAVLSPSCAVISCGHLSPGAADRESNHPTAGSLAGAAILQQELALAGAAILQLCRSYNQNTAVTDPHRDNSSSWSAIQPFANPRPNITITSTPDMNLLYCTNGRSHLSMSQLLIF